MVAGTQLLLLISCMTTASAFVLGLPSCNIAAAMLVGKKPMVLVSSLSLPKLSRRCAFFLRSQTISSEQEISEDIQTGDIVEFAHVQSGLASVGCVESWDSAGNLVLIRLTRREGLGNECYLDETMPKIYISPAQCRLIAAFPSQRVAWSSASPHFNPHGEESEDCWIIDSPLRTETVIPVKPISET